MKTDHAGSNPVGAINQGGFKMGFSVEEKKIGEGNVNIIYGGTGEGKTFQMVKKCSEVNGVYVVRSLGIKSIIEEMLFRLNLPKFEIITYEQFNNPEKMKGRNLSKKFFVDDILHYIVYIKSSPPIEEITFSVNSDELNTFTELKYKKEKVVNTGKYSVYVGEEVYNGGDPEVYDFQLVGTTLTLGMAIELAEENLLEEESSIRYSFIRDSGGKVVWEKSSSQN